MFFFSTCPSLGQYIYIDLKFHNTLKHVREKISTKNITSNAKNFFFKYQIGRRPTQNHFLQSLSIATEFHSTFFHSMVEIQVHDFD